MHCDPIHLSEPNSFPIWDTMAVARQLPECCFGGCRELQNVHMLLEHMEPVNSCSDVDNHFTGVGTQSLLTMAMHMAGTMDRDCSRGRVHPKMSEFFWAGLWSGLTRALGCQPDVPVWTDLVQTAWGHCGATSKGSSAQAQWLHFIVLYMT